MELLIIEAFLLYASGVCTGLGFMLLVVWVMTKTGHEVDELWGEDYED